MDLSIYEKQKAAGAVVLVKVGPDTVVTLSPRFDETTGASKPVETEQFNLVGLDEAISKTQAQLDALVAFRADIAATLAGEVKP